MCDNIYEIFREAFGDKGNFGRFRVLLQRMAAVRREGAFDGALIGSGRGAYRYEGIQTAGRGAERGFREAEIQTLVFQKEEKQS